MTTSRLVAGSLGVALLAAVVFSASRAEADPVVCGTHEAPSNCSPQTRLPTAGESAFLTDVRYQRIPGGDAQLLSTARAICTMLEGGVSINYVVPYVAAHLGLTNEVAGQVVDSATAYVCPGAPLNV